MQNRKLIVNINTHTGEFLNLNLPIDFVRKMIDSNTFDFFNYEEDAIDSQKILKLITNAFNYDLHGYLGKIVRNNNDIIELSIE